MTEQPLHERYLVYELRAAYVGGKARDYYIATDDNDNSIAESALFIGLTGTGKGRRVNAIYREDELGGAGAEEFGSAKEASAAWADELERLFDYQKEHRKDHTAGGGV